MIYKIGVLSLLLITYSVSAISTDSKTFRESVLPELSSTCSTSKTVVAKKLFPDREDEENPISNVDFSCPNGSLNIKEGYDGKLFFTYNDGYQNSTFVYKGRLESTRKNGVSIKFYDGFKNINDDVNESESNGFNIINIKPE